MYALVSHKVLIAPRQNVCKNVAMTSSTLAAQELARAVEPWLAKFAEALEHADSDAAIRLLSPDAYWRDLLAVSWDVHTFYGSDQIRSAMDAYLPAAKVCNLQLNPELAPRRVIRGGTAAIEFLIDFDLAAGHGRGVIRLVEDPRTGAVSGWNLLTSLEELAGFPQRLGGRNDSIASHARDFRGPNWLDRRIAEARFDDRDPAVLVVGAGQAGLAAAARLRQLDTDVLVVDRMGRVGDNWRKRYHSLVLHNEVWANHLPYMPFPDTWPIYIPKDLLADWFESYAEFMELNIWTSTDFLGASYDRQSELWTVELQLADGSRQQLHPRHIVMASGVSGIAHWPSIDGFDEYRGEVFHTSQFNEGHRFQGKRVIVLGTGTSGHDVAQDLWSHGAQVTIVQRSSTTVVSVGPDAAGKVYSMYREGNSIEVTDLVNVSTPYPVLRHSYQLLSRDLADIDRTLLDGLKSVGFKLDYGEDNTGFQMKYLRKGGGYYLDVGCAQLLIDGKVKLQQFDDIDAFTTSGVRLRDGSELPADAVVFATGYLGQQELVRRLFDDTIAEKVGPIWGYDDEGELQAMWRRTGQAGLWFTAGSLAQCRIYSKYLALQIKACEEGIISSHRPDDDPRGTLREVDLTDVVTASPV
jgi:cation diffusion facilitator CzcD-associated flavoprotein CzcO